MDPITLLLQKSQKYLRSAAILLQMEDFDSTASRAYFAMHYAAQALLMRHGVRLSGGQSLRTIFNERFVDTGALPAVARDAFDSGYHLMETGDFAHTFGVTVEQAEGALAQAEAFVNSVSPLAEA